MTISMRAARQPCRLALAGLDPDGLGLWHGVPGAQGPGAAALAGRTDPRRPACTAPSWPLDCWMLSYAATLVVGLMLAVLLGRHGRRWRWRCWRCWAFSPATSAFSCWRRMFARPQGRLRGPGHPGGAVSAGADLVAGAANAAFLLVPGRHGEVASVRGAGLGTRAGIVLSGWSHDDPGSRAALSVSFTDQISLTALTLTLRVSRRSCPKRGEMHELRLRLPLRLKYCGKPAARGRAAARFHPALDGPERQVGAGHRRHRLASASISSRR